MRGSFLGFLRPSTLVLVAACSDEVAGRPLSPRDDDAGALSSFGADANVDPSPAIPVGTGEISLRVLREDGLPVRVFAFAQHDARDVALIVDTGSQITFLSSPGKPDGIANAGTIVIGGESRVVRGRPIVLEGADAKVDGRPVVGFLGNDYFLERMREIDLRAEKIRTVVVPRATDDAPPPPVGWTSIPFENRHDFLLGHVKLDGEDLVLAFDTGAPHTFWLGRDGQPGDIPRSTNDAHGNPVILYQGTAMLDLLGEAPRRVPVLRAKSFPSLEESNAQIGGGISGLLGLSTIGDRRIRIDAVRKTIWVEPL